MAAEMAGVSMDEYLSTTATVAANKSEMTLKMYLEIVEEDPPQRSFLTTESPVSIIIWRDASEAREPYCEAVPTNGLKLAPKTYDSTDGNLCAHVLQSPESRETWRETCRQKALFMGKLVHNRLHIMFLSVAGFFSICMLPVAACLHPIQEALRTGGRPWRGLISASIFLTIMGGISFLAVLNAQSFHHCDPLFEVEKGRYDYAWGFTIAAFGIPSLFHLAVWIAFVLSCIKSRPAGIEKDEIELGIVRLLTVVDNGYRGSRTDRLTSSRVTANGFKKRRAAANNLHLILLKLNRPRWNRQGLEAHDAPPKTFVRFLIVNVSALDIAQISADKTM